MGLYQGRALRSEPLRPRPTRVGRVLMMARGLVVLGIVVSAVQLPWQAWRSRIAVVRDVHVEGAEYLDARRVAAYAGIAVGSDLLALDLERARQELLLHARVADARITRRGISGVRIQIRERHPVLLVRHGAPWEIDSTGVLLAPFADGAVADVPLLTGPLFESYPEGALVNTAEVRRGIAWVRALSVRELQLGGKVSEIDVSSVRSTTLVLMSGTRVLSSVWPPDVRTLSALRVALIDLEARGIAAQEVDLRFEDRVIVRPLEPAHAAGVPGSRTS